MQQRRAPQVAQLVRRRSRARRAIADRDPRDAVRVAPGVRRLGVDDHGERLGDAVEAVVVGAQHAVRGLERRRPRGAAQAAERRPELVVAPRRAQRVDERGIEPGAAALGRDVERGARAGGGEEHLDGLGEAEDAAEERDRVAGEAVRVAGAVPVLVEAADRLRGASPRARSCARCRRRARSAARSSRARPRRRCGRSPRAGACGRCATHVAQRARPGGDGRSACACA